MQPMKLNNIMPEPADGGIFETIKSWAPWRASVDADVLDLDYIYNHSGYKTVAPMLYRFAEINVGGGNDPDLTSTQLASIGKILRAHYEKNWTKLWATMNVTYDPLENYYREESGSDTLTKSGTVTDDGSDDLTHGEVVTAGGTDTTERSVYGYDSGTPAPSEKEVYTPLTTATHSGTDERALGNERTYDTTDETTYGKTTRGNIGVVTSQQMLREERDVWLWDFFTVIYKDIDRVLTIPVYL